MRLFAMTTFAACVIATAAVAGGPSSGPDSKYNGSSYVSSHEAVRIDRHGGRRYARHRHHKKWARGSRPRAHTHATTGTVRQGRGVIRSKFGAVAYVNAAYTQRFQCLVNKLDASGYRIKVMTGYAHRPNNYSLHPTGRALDIDQCSRNYLCHRRHYPAGVNAWARACGLDHADFHLWPRSPDYGHFQINGHSWAGEKIEKKEQHAAVCKEPPYSGPVMTVAYVDTKDIDLAVAKALEDGAPIARQDILQEAREYLVKTAHPGGTMERQGVRESLKCFLPEFAVKLAGAIKEARENGLRVGVSSACRPPVLGVGGYRNKFDSNHAYGLAADMKCIFEARYSNKDCELVRGNVWTASEKWHRIARKHGLYNPYWRTRAYWEFNHYQPMSDRKVADYGPLRRSINKYGPIDLQKTWKIARRFVPDSQKILALIGGARDAVIATTRAVSHVAKASVDTVKVAAIDTSAAIIKTKNRAVALIEDAAGKHKLDGRTMVAFAYLENGNRFDEKYRPVIDGQFASTAVGIFGLTAKERNRVGQRHHASLEEQVEKGLKHIAEDRDGLRHALGREPTREELYIAHFQGLGAAVSIIKARDNENLRIAIDRGERGLGWKALKANPGLKKLRTVGAFKRSIRERMSEALAAI